MGANSKIKWTDHTFNPWMGCEKISPACANCYAEVSTPVRVHRAHGMELWGGHARRKIKSDWSEPVTWNEEAGQQRPRVFCASLADVFEDRPDLVEPRERLFELIGQTQNLDWLLLTKRPNIAASLVPYYAGRVAGLRGVDPALAATIHGGLCLPNVWLGVTVEDRKHGLPRIGILRGIYAKVRFLSIEPLLEDLGQIDLTGIHWVIVGGESGKRARPMKPEWARSIRDQCLAAGVPFFFKQWGEWAPNEVAASPAAPWKPIGADRYDDIKVGDDGEVMLRIGKKPAGRMLDGREWNELPKAI